MILISLIVNILVLIPVIGGLLANSTWAVSAYGPQTQARGILLSIYGAILFASVALLFIWDPRMIAALLAVQVIYKVTTPFTVGTFKNPVVISNLSIAALHSITMMVIWAM
ncbi:MAG: hypothetical protein AAFV53_14275 [Myxococcota bacterium]